MLLLLATLAHAEDIQVTSNLKGATIFLNGVDTGLRTPATIHNVEPGTAQVSVSSGCDQGEATVTVTRGATARVSLMALPGSAIVNVTTDPANARVFLDDAPYDSHVGEPTSMDCGVHTFRAEADGYVVSTVSVDLKADEEMQLPISLAKIGFGNLDLSVQPRNATMYLDGKPVGTDAVTLPSVASGKHTISAKSQTYKTPTATITVSDGDDQAWHFDLVHDSSSKESTTTQLRGPHPGEVISGTGTAAAPGKASTSKSTSATSSSTKTTKAPVVEDDDEDLDEPVKSTSTKTSSSSKTTDTKTTDTSSGGDDYFSRLRAQQGATDSSSTTSTTKTTVPDDDLDEDSTPTKSSGSSSSKSTSSKTTSPTKEPTSSSSSSSGTKTTSSSSSSSSSKSTKTDDLDEPDTSTKSTKSTKSSAGNKTGLDVAGVSMLVLGAGSGAGAFYFYDKTSVAYDAYNSKVAAGQASKDPALISAAQDYYDNTLVPRRNLMYATAGGTVAFLATGITLIVVDDHLPYVLPMRGGAMLGWSTAF